MARVLVVDDDDSVRLLVRRALEREGLRVEEAPDRDAGLESFDRVAWDLVVLDVSLPDLSGLDLLRPVPRPRRRAGDHAQRPGQRSRPHRRAGVRGRRLPRQAVLAPRARRAVRSLLRRAPPSSRRGGRRPGCRRRAHPRGHRERPGVDLTAKEFDLLGSSRVPRQAFSRGSSSSTCGASSPGWQDASTVTEHVRRSAARSGRSRPVTVDRHRARCRLPVRAVSAVESPDVSDGTLTGERSRRRNGANRRAVSAVESPDVSDGTRLGVDVAQLDHDLRGPLNAILGFGRLLEAEDLTAERRAEVVEQIVIGGERLRAVLAATLGGV